jgi:aerobic carbon-monoxide dehydrogenase medium subunit
MHEFTLHCPASISEALDALKQEGAQPLSGGQTLIPTMKQRLAAPEHLVSLTAVPELRGVTVERGIVRIGGATPHAEVAAALGTAYPALAALAGGIGDPAVRNRGTIGGSLANNDPSACYPAAALASDAAIVTDRREIPVAEYFEGMFTTALEEDEIITAVTLPIPDRAAYLKFSQPASRFALVGVFVADFGGTVRVAVTGASEDGVFRWSGAEAALSAEFVPEAIRDLSVPPDGMIADIWGSAEYRANLVAVLTRRAVAAARG